MATEQCALRLLLLTVNDWVNRNQQEVLEYLVEENRGAVSADILKFGVRVLVPRAADCGLSASISWHFG